MDKNYKHPELGVAIMTYDLLANVENLPSIDEWLRGYIAGQKAAYSVILRFVTGVSGTRASDFALRLHEIAPPGTVALPKVAEEAERPATQEARERRSKTLGTLARWRAEDAVEPYTEAYTWPAQPLKV